MVTERPVHTVGHRHAVQAAFGYGWQAAVQEPHLRKEADLPASTRDVDRALEWPAQPGSLDQHIDRYRQSAREVIHCGTGLGVQRHSPGTGRRKQCTGAT